MGVSGMVEVRVVLGRRLLGTLLTVYIPTILLITISHMTNYFKPFFFEAIVSVNLTVMLVGLLARHPAGARHNVHCCVGEPPQDLIHQDGRYLAHIQPDGAFL